MSYRPYNQLKASGLEDTRTNNTGATIPKGTPVRINTSGELDFVNVSIENEVVNIAGVASQSIPTASAGVFLSSGKIEDITTTADFGDFIYISKSGNFTNAKPTIGVGGFLASDFVISVGVVAKNESNPTLKDLIINIDVQGQL
jgi:hypothetical protein